MSGKPVPSYPSMSPPRLPAWLWGLLLVLSAAFFCLDHDYRTALKKDLLVDQPTEVGELVEEQSPLRPVGYLLLGCSSLALWLVRPRFATSWKSLGLWCLVGYLLWCCASVVWSDDPNTTAKRLVPLALLVLTALGMSRHIGTEHSWVVGWVAPTVHLLVGLAAEFQWGTLRPWQSEFRLCGTTHPNTLGLQLAILLLALYCAKPWRLALRWPILLLGTIALCALILTKSRTALATLVIGLGMTTLPQASLAFRVVLLIVFPFLVSIGLLVAVLWDWRGIDTLSSLLLLGRAEEAGTLTGRLPLWEHLLWYVRERPWLGYGYGGFWTPQRVLKISERLDWVIAHAHNAFLEVTLNIGLVGLALMLIMAMSAFGKAYIRYWLDRELRWQFICGFSAMAAVFSLTEGLFAQHGFPMFCLMCCLTVAWTRDDRTVPIRVSARSVAKCQVVPRLSQQYCPEV